MRGSRNALLIVLSEGMLLSWVYAWASFIMPMAGRRPFPLLEGALILALATLISLLHRGRGWRVIYIITLHAAALLLAALRMIYVHFEWSHSFWSREWVVTLLAEQRTVLEWFILLLILFWAVVLWIGAIKIALKSVDLSTMGSRFDLGTAFFLLLLLIQLVMLGKGVPLHPASNGELSFLAFFVLALLGLGMARHEASAEKSYMAAYRGIGVILSFVVFAFLFGGGLVILFLPALMDAAELGHGLLKAVARPVLPILVAVLRVLLISGCHRVREDPPSAKSKDAGPDLPVPGGEEGGILEQIMIWGFAAMGVLLGLGILVCRDVVPGSMAFLQKTRGCGRAGSVGHPAAVDRPVQNHAPVSPRRDETGRPRPAGSRVSLCAALAVGVPLRAASRPQRNPTGIRLAPLAAVPYAQP